ncbi:hypothetical protein ACFXMT_14295 [Streptomyces mirabilis]|uniref:hypothetical protein n=1 Tax=Streptomyces mirabilis TaxID=68239 RepID=UPI0036B55039
MTVSLPIHSLTGDMALGFRKDGRPIWPIKGGSGEGEGGNAGGDQGGSQGDQGDAGKGGDQGDGNQGDSNPGDQGAEGEAELGEAGKKALKTERDARKAAEKERETLKAENDRLRRSNAAVKGVDVDAIKTEIRAEFQTQLAETAIKAEAKGRLTDPTDALLYVKAADIDTSDDKAVEKAITDLLAARPYLAAADGGAKPWGDVGGGKTPSAEPEPSTPEERMRRAYDKASK